MSADSRTLDYAVWGAPIPMTGHVNTTTQDYATWAAPILAPPETVVTVSETILHSQTNTPSLAEAQDTSEINILTVTGTATPSITDYEILYSDVFRQQQTITLTIVEVIGTTEDARNVGVNTPNLGIVEDTLVNTMTNTPSESGFTDGDITETVDAEDGADSTDVGGYNTSGRNIPSLTDASTTLIIDTTQPTLNDAWGGGTTLILGYSETLDPASDPSPSDFAVVVEGVPCTVTVAAVFANQNWVWLTLACTITEGDDVTISYTPGVNPIQDLAGNDAIAFSDRFVNTDDSGTPPTGGEEPVDRPGDEWSGGARGITMGVIQFRAKEPDA